MKYFVVAVSTSLNYGCHPVPITDEDDVITLYDNKKEAEEMQCSKYYVRPVGMK